MNVPTVAPLTAIYLLTLLTLTLALSGCQAPLLSELKLEPATISPNGDGVDDSATLQFRLGRRANLTIALRDSKGKEIVLRDGIDRAPDLYALTFDGAVQVDNQGNKRVLPDGDYTFVVTVTDDSERASQQIVITIKDADTTPVEITSLVTSLPTISPNGDAIDDEVRVSYGLTKESRTEVYVLAGDGQRFLIEPPRKKNATLQSHIWNGTSGGKVAPDGDYQFIIEAWDTAGNFSVASAPVRVENGGVSRLEIVDVKFSPVALPKGGILNVRVRVKNTGQTRLKTMGPPPDTSYTTEMNFATFRDPKDPNIALYYERPGVWRVGVGWTNAPQNFPVRWGLFKGLDQELMPGEEAIVTGQIQVLESSTRELTFYVSVVQEGVGFPGGQVGHTIVKVSF